MNRPFLTDAELYASLGGTADSAYSKVKRLLAQGKLLHIRKGLYVPTEAGGCFEKPHPYALAPFIYGPSYISLESALSFHGLIPEGVRTITSVCSKRSKVFNTPLGLFSFERLPALDFYVGVSMIQESDTQFFIATPWKAICDYVYVYKKNWTNCDPLYESLRIESDALPPLSFEEIQSLDEYYHQHRITKFLKGVNR